jgi:predicted O-methyltransferase YrrM
MESTILIEQVLAGQRDAYAWGCGEVFEACRALRPLPLRAFVHTSTALIGTRVHGLPVIAPCDLDSLDAGRSVVIAYSADYREQIAACVGNLPGLPLIHFDSPALVSANSIAELASAIKLARSVGILKPAGLRRLKEAVGATREPEESWGLARELESGYDFYTEHHRARYQALTSHTHFLHQENIDGDIAEFGTGYGTTAVFLAAAMADASLAPVAPWAASQATQVRQLHLFDSFQGLPSITHPLDIAAGWKEGLFRDKSAPELRRMVEKYLAGDRIVVHAGWFKDTLTSIPANKKFSLLHIDCDIYESTIEVLDFLFAGRHLSNGCAVFFDDWNCGGASPALGERRAWREIVEKYRVDYSDSGDYGTYGHKFLVHVNDSTSVPR